MVKINPETPVQLARHRLLLAREAVRAIKMADEKPAKERLAEILGMIKALVVDLDDVLEWHYGAPPAGPEELPTSARPWLAVWGNASLGTEAGVLDAFACRAEADECVRNFLTRHEDNPAVGAWVCYRD